MHTYIHRTYIYVKMRSTNNASSHDELSMQTSWLLNCILSPINKQRVPGNKGWNDWLCQIIDRSLAGGAKKHTSYHITEFFVYRHVLVCISALYIGILMYIRKLTSRVCSKKWQATSPEPSSLFFSRWPHSPHSDWPATHPNGAARNDGPWTEWGSGPGL